MKWNDSTKTTDTKKHFYQAFSLKSKQGTKIELKCISIKYVKHI